MHAQEQTTLGFDLEWKFDFRKHYRTALMQVAVRGDAVSFDAEGRYPRVRAAFAANGVPTAEGGLVYLLHLSRFVEAHQGLPKPLVELLESPDALKVGLNIAGDAARLKRDFGVDISGTVEVREVVARKLGDTCGGVPTRKSSLAKLAADQLGVEVDKTLQCSDWNVELTNDQQEYAALDAWLPLEIFRSVQDLPDLHPAPEKAAEAPAVARAKRASKAVDEEEDLDDRGRLRFELLRQWRDRRCKQMNMPPYVVLQNRSLLALAGLEIGGSSPLDPAELGGVWGMGEVKVKRYGEQIARVINTADAQFLASEETAS
jgi:ribonuclease D